MRSIEQLYKDIEGVAEFSGINIDGPETVGLFSNRPLHVAAIWNDCEAIDMLVAAGADINVKGEHGFTPLFEASAQDNYEAVKRLIELGAKAIRNDDGLLPSEYVSNTANERTVNLLREHGL
ncbi:ankyrin repeat domain-containing protein [Alteromonas flava]|uniref:ankyrin repeat domain-containing protein n=1 Tax=Alteromonas flava TaxID=2048003 RepID=UPI000C28435E|nr:ankyrin repeat domain-containing protein [Alteromonas flava]